MGKKNGRGKGTPLNLYADEQAAAAQHYEEQYRRHVEADRAHHQQALADNESQRQRTAKRNAMTPEERLDEAAKADHMKFQLMTLCADLERADAHQAGRQIRPNKKGCAGSLDVMSSGGAAGPMMMNHFTTAVRMQTMPPTQTAHKIAQTLATIVDNRQKAADVREILRTQHGMVAEASGDVINAAASNLCNGNNPNRRQIERMFTVQRPESRLVTAFYQDWETALRLVPQYIC